MGAPPSEVGTLNVSKAVLGSSLEIAARTEPGIADGGKTRLVDVTKE